MLLVTIYFLRYLLYSIYFIFPSFIIRMNIFDSEPCDDKKNKLKLTCGEVYVITNVIDISKKIFQLDLINSSKLDINKMHKIIPEIMKKIKRIVDHEIIADIYYFYLSSLDDKIEKFIKENPQENITIDDICVLSRTKCEDGKFNFSIQYKICMYITKLFNN